MPWYYSLACCLDNIWIDELPFTDCSSLYLQYSPGCSPPVSPLLPDLAQVSIPLPTNVSPVIVSVNCNGILSKMDDMRVLAAGLDPEVITIQETKLDASILDHEIVLPKYMIFRKDRTRSSGGVLAYVKPLSDCSG